MLAKKIRFGLVVLTVFTMLSVVLVAKAQDREDALSANPNSGVSKELESQWKDFIYFIKIGTAESAKSFGEKILEGASAKQIYKLTVTYRSRDALIQGSKLKGVSKICKKMLALADKGFLEWRKDPEEIMRSIKMLAGLGRAQRVGLDRLKMAGEYALPLMISELYNKETSEVQRAGIINALGKLGRHAVRGLTMVLKAKDLDLVKVAAGALGKIQYPSALPRLKEALDRKDVQNDANCKQAVEFAMIRCARGNVKVLEISSARLFLNLAKQYYRTAESLRHGLITEKSPLAPDHRYKLAFVWAWREGTGLDMYPVPKSIFCDIYTMRMARLALKYNPKLYEAIPLWLSAVTRRELNLKDGEKDLLWGKDQPKAEYYLLASSPKYLKIVLFNALKNNDVALASRAIAAMAKNTGAKSLASSKYGIAPFVEAMRYPDRALRYQAAETLVLACPRENFNGRDLAMSLLNEALRQKGERTAIIVAKGDNKNLIKNAVLAAGFAKAQVVTVDNLRTAAANLLNLDTVIVGPTVNTKVVRSIVRNKIAHRYVPIVTCDYAPSLRNFVKKDGKMVQLKNNNITNETIEAAIKQADKLATGKPLDEEGAIDWAIRAANAIKVAGVRGNTTYDLTKFIDALIVASKSELSNDLQIAAAQALATINDTKGRKPGVAQQAVVTLALDENAKEKVRIAALKAASESVKNFGNYCTETQCKAIEKIVTTKGSLALMDAAAQLLGTLNLSSQEGAGVIQSTRDLDTAKPGTPVEEPKLEEPKDDDTEEEGSDEDKAEEGDDEDSGDEDSDDEDEDSDDDDEDEDDEDEDEEE